MPHGGLQLSWEAGKAGKVRLPIITYHESQLTVNDHLLRHYQRSSVGAPYIQQRKGKNTVTLYFKQAKWFTALLVISLVGLSILGKTNVRGFVLIFYEHSSIEYNPTFYFAFNTNENSTSRSAGI